MDTVTAANERNEIARFKSVLIHMVFDRLYWVGKVERIVSALPCLNQRHQHIEAIARSGVLANMTSHFFGAGT